MQETDIIDLMMHHGVKPTANRILIANAFVKEHRPLSMSEIEVQLESVDKSVISRTLSLFRERHLVHILPDGGDGVRYELCHRCSDDHDDDAHIHFYCSRCGKTFCLEDIPIPEVTLPQGYQEESVNYMVTGLCPDCR
ncbi:MAG: transcriptional repressor [Bacteroidales bacterium]|nr:transcriptional repressor [Bacteroidales bacterium]